MSHTPDLIRELKTAGHRITKARQSLADILCKTKTPMSAAELITQLKKRGVAVNKTTIYREIEFFLANKVVREVDFLDGKKRYELLVEGDHHHHMICTRCNGIQCIEMANDLDILEKDLFNRFNFKVTSHTLEFFGVCKRCR